MASQTFRKDKAHTIYKNLAGNRVPGTTTILGVLGKPALVPWANRLGLEGIDVANYVDTRADIGTLAHAMIAAHLQQGEMSAEELDEYSPKVKDLAENAFISYLSWEKAEGPLVPSLIEKPGVSELYQYGGTRDFYGTRRDVACVIDFKSGGAIYEEAGYQLAAYDQITREGGLHVEEAWIVRVPRTEDESFEAKRWSREMLNRDFEVFKHALAIYCLKRDARREAL